MIADEAALISWERLVGMAPVPELVPADAVPETVSGAYSTGCAHSCGGRCVLEAEVEDGVVVGISTDNGPEPQLRACLRGRSYRQRLYHVDRLKYPMIRDGERGRGEFARVSWDEALGRVAAEIRRVIREYGSQAILDFSFGGNVTLLHSTYKGPVTRLLNMLGGPTGLRGGTSANASLFASLYTYGTRSTVTDPEDMLNAKLILLWSWNSAETIRDTGTTQVLRRARQAGIPIVCIDPRFTATAAAVADRWIPIRPGTDTAMLLAMAHVLITRQLVDRGFLNTYAIGFEHFERYVLGEEDGLPKTPSWAEAMTGVPAPSIEWLAVEVGTKKPVAIRAGWGMQRTGYGEQPARALIVLAAMTGNVGIPGGGAAGVDGALAPRLRGLPSGRGRSDMTVPVVRWADAILKGKAGGYGVDIKMLYVTGANILNSLANTNKGVDAMKALEFVVVHEQFLTPTARFADVLLPVNTFFERADICTTWVHSNYAIYMPKIMASLFESKSDLEITTELARRLGIQGYNDLTDEEWLRSFVEAEGSIAYDEFKRKPVHHFAVAESHVAFREQIRDPTANPFPTPSGKIEIYSARLAEMNRPDIPPIPRYIESWEGPNDPLAARYPLQLITPQSKRRAHSTYDNLPWLQEVEPQAIWIHPSDASSRGIAEREKVRVFNDRGKVIIRAKVTECIMPGVVCIVEGAWYDPAADGTDRGGCANVLTNDVDTPLGEGAAFNACLVQVEKAPELPD